ncbi:MAG: DUF3617 family protein [Smithellaceae bacterium]|jgi:hypothetical protein|nr:DUF3617 family protein [Syntrophaceae bacterium]MDD4241295.1 DUF3617 family protein [Smithellaceae bacterium]NLX52953.1 DUF3617 family protein [Deltaproteobacteria bacterium]
MKKSAMFLIVAALVLWTAAAQAQLKDGLWEITSQVQISGMQQQMPPATFRQCITKSDPVVKNQDKDYNCKTTSLKVSGNTVTYAVECKGKEGAMFSEGKNTYTGSTMEGAATTNFKMQGQPAMQMKSKMSGKYIGPCK